MGTFWVIVLAAALAPLPAQTTPDVVVQELREFSSRIGQTMRSDGKPVPFEARRTDLYKKIAALGKPGVQAMGRALTEGDAQLRTGAALALNAMGGGWFDGPKVDVLPALPALITALGDTEEMVRAWSAQAIGSIGPDAVSAVPALVTLLGRSDRASRNSACLGLRGIGSAAHAALPALEVALSDSDADTRGFAAQAITAIKKVP